MKKRVAVSEAIELLLGAAKGEPGRECVRLEDALGRVSAEDALAPHPYPGFTRSPFDGYAFRASDVSGAGPNNPVTLSINQEIACGQEALKDVPPGFAAKILTGAPIPDGADVVIKYEETEYDETTVKIFEPHDSGANIIRPGEDYPAGTLIAAKGEIVTPAMLGMFAEQGIEFVNVFTKPRVAMINTGDELVTLGHSLPPGKIYNSSMYTLGGIVREMGAELVNRGVAPDDAEVISEMVREAAETADLVITTGGASVGDYDFALRAAECAGAEILFWKAAMKPGGAILAYVLSGDAPAGGTVVLALSGNPGAAALGLLRLALPCVRKLSGRRDVYPERIDVILSEAVRKPSPQTRLMRGVLSLEDGKAYFKETGSQGSGDISSLARCDLLVEIPEGSEPIPAGTLITGAYRI